MAKRWLPWLLEFGFDCPGGPPPSSRAGCFLLYLGLSSLYFGCSFMNFLMPEFALLACKSFSSFSNSLGLKSLLLPLLSLLLCFATSGSG